jgi:hypothetical protein
MARVGLLPGDSGVALVQVSEGDCTSWAGPLTGGLDFIRAYRSVLALGSAAGGADALNAISTLFHDAPRTYRYFRIFLSAIGVKAEIGVLLAIGVTEEIEAAYLIRAIRLAESSANAAVVNLHVQPFTVMY